MQYGRLPILAEKIAVSKQKEVPYTKLKLLCSIDG